MKIRLFTLLILSSFSYGFLSCCLSKDEDAKMFFAGDSRESVYALMGQPSNVDDDIVAVWVEDIDHKKNWRLMDYSNCNPIMAFFDKDKSVCDKRTKSEFELPKGLSDESLLHYVKIMQENLTVQFK